MNSTEAASTERAPSCIRHLAVGADASAAGREGLRIAMEAAQRTGARISVVHVRHVPAGGYWSQSTAPGPVEETLDEVEAEVRRATAEAMNGTDLEWTFVVLRGCPGEELVRFVAEERADLGVVIGGQEGLVVAAIGHREPADEVGQPRVGGSLQARVLMQE